MLGTKLDSSTRAASPLKCRVASPGPNVGSFITVSQFPAAMFIFIFQLIDFFFFCQIGQFVFFYVQAHSFLFLFLYSASICSQAHTESFNFCLLCFQCPLTCSLLCASFIHGASGLFQSSYDRLLVCCVAVAIKNVSSLSHCLFKCWFSLVC